MNRPLSAAFAAAAVALSLGGARAADLPPPALAPAPDATPFFVKLGVGGLFLSEKADVRLGGALLPAATIKVKPQYTLLFEVGYNFTSNWAVAFAGGLPPVAKIDGAGSAEPFGRLGSVRYGPTALLAQYHFDFGAFRPYVGAGPGLMVVLKNQDRFLSGFDLRPAGGLVGQVGVDFMLTERVGLFVDAKKMVLRTSAVGSALGAPVKAKVTLDPLVVSTGLVARF